MSNHYAMTLGELRLLDGRSMLDVARTGLYQKDIAELFGVSRGSVSDYLRGIGFKRTPAAPTKAFGWGRGSPFRVGSRALGTNPRAIGTNPRAQRRRLRRSEASEVG